MIEYDKTSPYYQTDISKGYLDVMISRSFRGQDDDILWSISKKYEFRPDLLAYNLYGKASLYWVFAARNKDIIKDPIFDMIAGVKIYLPKLSTLKEDLGV